MSKIYIVFILIGLNTSLWAQTLAEAALAAQYFQNGEYENALTIYRQLFEKSRSQAYYDQYFTTLLRLKKYDEAEKLVKKSLKLIPNNPAYQVDYGRVLQEKGDQEKAKEWYRQLVDNLPKTEFAIRELATMFYRAEAYEFSVKTLLAGRSLLNDETAFTFDLISLYRFQKNKDLLIQEFLNALDHNPEMLTQAKNILSSALDKTEDYALLKKLLLNKIQKNPSNIAYAELLTWTYMQQQEFSLALKQTVALDKRLKEDGQRVYELSWTLISNKAYIEAIECLNYLVNKGSDNSYYIPAKIQLLNTKNQLLLNGSYNLTDWQQLETEYQSLLKEFGTGSNTVFAVRQLATLQAFYLNKPQEAVELIESLLKIPQLSASVIGQAKLDLGDYYILTDEHWEAALIYGQVEKQFANEPLGQEAKFRNARLSYFRGDFIWAKAQLDVLKSSTSQLIANDALNLSLMIAENTDNETDSTALSAFAKADLLTFKKQFDIALTLLDSINQAFPSNSLSDDILMMKAKIYQQQNKLNEAAEQLQLIITNYSYDLWGDDAIFMLAELNEEKLNNPEKAKELYQKLITDYTGSLYLIEARKRFRNLRGDAMN